MKSKPLYNKLTAFTCLLLLVSCGGGSGGSGSGSSSGNGSGGSGGNSEYEVAANFIKGPVTGGSCELFRVGSNGEQGNSLGVAENSVDGLVEFSSPLSYTGTVLIECSGGTYEDEATGAILDAPNTRAVARLDSDKSFVISPLTEMAVQLAEADGSLATALTTYNSQIAELFGVGGDITETLPVGSLDEIEDIDDSAQYLLALSLISQMHADSESSLTALVSTLSIDLRDSDLGSSSIDALDTALDNLGLEEINSQVITTLFQSLEEALADYHEAGPPVDVTAPSGYSITGLTNPVNSVNQSEVRFSVEGAELGASYTYRLYSSADGSAPFLEGSGTVSSADFDITDLDLSQAGDGVIELHFFLSDEANNLGQTLTATANKSSGPVENVTISGTVTFDRVGRNSINGSLDYADIRVEPARGVRVEAVNSSGTELATTSTDSNGQYSLAVTEHTYVRIRVRAEMIRNEAASWNVSVKDNTNNDALYALQGDLFSSGGEDSIRDLNAESGWTGDAYNDTRSAAPFAILDTVYKTMEKFVAVDPDVNFPPLKIFWSRNNNSTSGNKNNGDIGTSYYSAGSFYILGDENGDTDEYDEHVIAHEWGHYFEDRLSRSDSIGGSHSLDDRLDMRVAFGEGWGNAISAIALDDPIYTDSSGSGQSSGFTFDIEENNNSAKGWYSESSAQSIIYDIYDNQSDDADTLSLGLAPIYDTFIASDYINTDYLTSIFVFLDKLKQVIPGSTAGIDALALEQEISGTGPDGIGETNDGDIADTLPVYKNVSIGASVELCSNEQHGAGQDNHNMLGGRDFAFLEVASTQNLTITASRSSGTENSDPDFYIFDEGSEIVWSKIEETDIETWSGQLVAGNYVIEVHDWKVTGKKVNDGSGSRASCFDLTVTSD